VSAAQTLLEVNDLVARYPVPRGISGALLRRPRRHVHAVEGVSFVLHEGEMVALVGESGCGKTTTAQSVMRMVERSEGQIRFAGRELTALSPRALRPLRREMMMIYQDPYESLNPRFRVRETVAEPLRIHGIGTTRDERERLVLAALARAELTPPELYIDRHPHELSGGQRQRLAIAAALVLEPRLLIADEPVSMLDVSVRAGILTLLARQRAQGLAILMITHDLATAARFADRIAVMYLGRIVEEGPARAVIEDPRHPYTRALVSVAPRRHRGDGQTPQILQGEPPDPVNVPTGCRFHPRCPLAIAQCRAVDPTLREVTTAGGERTPESLTVDPAHAGHRVACIRAAPGPEMASSAARTAGGRCRPGP
jgi:oligopeptide/dipeptide ABC transporter ATP-binding protein